MLTLKQKHFGRGVAAIGFLALGLKCMWDFACQHATFAVEDFVKRNVDSETYEKLTELASGKGVRG